MTDPRTALLDAAFETHAWGDMGDDHGEARCLRCGAATSWPLAEQQCAGGRIVRERLESRPQMTEAELKEAIALHDGGMSWRNVGERMRRNANGLRRMAAEYQAGRGRLAQRERGAG